MNELFDVFLYSHGTQVYASAIARLIDPECKSLKQERIIGRHPVEECQRKTLATLLPEDDCVSVILDDKQEVWKHQRNLILIFPYVYFKTTAALSYDSSLYGTLPPFCINPPIF